MNVFEALHNKKTIFDLINEADDDNAGGDNTAGDAGAAPAGDAGGGDEGTDDADFGNEDDFDINTSLGGDEDQGDDTDNDGFGDTGDSGDDSGSYSTDSSGDTDEEPVKKNTDIFTSLTKEEQAIKIGELKKLYNDLYISIDDMFNKFNDINPDEDTLVPITKVSSAMYSLKISMADYIQKSFPYKTYIENDIMYNRYLTIIQSMSTIIDQITKELEEKVQKDDKKSQQ